MVNRKQLLAITLLLVMTTSKVVFALESPEDFVRGLLGTIQKINGEDGIDPEQRRVNTMLSAQALSFLDMDTVGRKALGKYWKHRSEQEKKSFIILLSQLFKKIAFKNSARFFMELDIQYKNIKVDEGRATVPILVVHEEEGELEIDFSMHRAKKKWRLVDVTLDGVSMRSNLRSQFYKVIGGDGYSELIRRMNKKLQEYK